MKGLYDVGFLANLTRGAKMPAPTLETQLWKSLGEHDTVPRLVAEHHTTYQILCRFLQLARREGYVKALGDYDAIRDAARMLFPVHRTIKEPNIQECPNLGPWVRSDGEGGVNFFRGRKEAEEWDGSPMRCDNRIGVRAVWMPVILDVIANPTVTRTVEE